MEKSIIIIGAGLAGLSAGCYGQMNGYRTSIFEMHDKSRGMHWLETQGLYHRRRHALAGGDPPGKGLLQYLGRAGGSTGKDRH